MAAQYLGKVFSFGAAYGGAVLMQGRAYTRGISSVNRAVERWKALERKAVNAAVLNGSPEGML